MVLLSFISSAKYLYLLNFIFLQVYAHNRTMYIQSTVQCQTPFFETTWCYLRKKFPTKANVPYGVRLYPDAGVTVRVFGVGVGLAALPVRRVTELFDGLVNRHVVRQHPLSHQKLQLVFGCSLGDRHGSHRVVYIVVTVVVVWIIIVVILKIQPWF